MYQNTAKGLAALGRNGDSMLMHVNPQEVAALSKILGPVSTNPKTGLPEAYGWSSMLGSVLGGIGSFGVGSALSPIVGDIVGEGLIGDVLSKAVPALAGAGLGAVIGGATGGRSGALGGAAQGAMSGGLGAFASEDLLGSGAAKPTNDVQAMEQQVNKDVGTSTANALYKTSDVQPGLYKPDLLNQYEQSATDMPVSASADYKPATGTNYSSQLAGTEKPGFLDNLGTLGHKAFTSEGFKQYEDYVPYLFQAGMIGNAITSEQESKDAAQQTEEDFKRYKALRELQAQNFARSTYGYADGGAVQFQSKGPIPVSVHFPEHAVEEAKRAGGLGSFMNFANGGYINLQPEPQQGYYPMSQIPSAKPYPAATPQRQEVVFDNGYAQGGLLDGEGDGMSDDIDANIEGREPVKVADGEFIVPKHIVDMIGVDRLDELLKSVRRAAYGHEDQINEDAGLAAAKKELGLA